MKRIVVVNDDGPGSPGLRELLRSLGQLGHVLAVVPEEPIGGRGKSITLLEPLEVRELGPDFYIVRGTPADALLIALELSGGRVDLAVAGINLGPNIGIDDFFHSGTIGAAIQAAIHGIPALAISYGVGEGLPKPSGEQMESDLRLAAELAADLARAVLKSGLPEGVDLISVNVPVGADRSRIAVTDLYRRPFWRAVREGRFFYVKPWPGEEPRGPEGTDVWALLNGYISITPLSFSPPCDREGFADFLREAGVLP